MKLRVDNPREVGADRLVHAGAAFERFGGPGVVVDAGTSLTVDAVNRDGEFVGGVIAPGFRVAGEALFASAAQLPHVEMGVPPAGVIGRNTAHAVQSGLFHGYVGMLDALARGVRLQLDPAARVIATGDYAAMFADASTEIAEVDRGLALRGLALLYARHKR